jgi:hypothetical protein
MAGRVPGLRVSSHAVAAALPCRQWRRSRGEAIRTVMKRVTVTFGAAVRATCRNEPHQISGFAGGRGSKSRRNRQATCGLRRVEVLSPMPFITRMRPSVPLTEGTTDSRDHTDFRSHADFAVLKDTSIHGFQRFSCGPRLGSGQAGPFAADACPERGSRATKSQESVSSRNLWFRRSWGDRSVIRALTSESRKSRNPGVF